MKIILIANLILLSLPLLVVLLLLIVAMFVSSKAFLMLLVIVAYFGSMVAAVIWRIGTPAVEISETGFKVSIPFLYKTNSATWNEIEGMTFGNIRTFLVPDKQLKILLKSEGTATKEIILSLKAVEKPDEIVAKLRERIPELTYQDLSKSKVFEQPFTKTEVKFRKWSLTEKGIAGGSLFVPWNDVKAISYSGLVIGGYGATTITYKAAEGKHKSIILKPKTSPDYHDCIRYMLQHASHAALDPGLIKGLEYPPADARADMNATLLLIVAILLVFVMSMFMGAYSPAEGALAVFPIMPLILALLPMGMTLKLLVGRFRGKAEPASKKLLWSALANVVQVIAVVVFFIISPFSVDYVLGDISMKTSNLLGAEYWYAKALAEVPDNIDVSFDMGLLYREKNDYETAFNYLEKAYAKNPKYFGPVGLELIPDTLLKMEKYDDAISWCDRILNQHSRNRVVQEVLGRKRDEIVSAQARKAQLTQGQSVLMK